MVASSPAPRWHALLRAAAVARVAPAAVDAVPAAEAVAAEGGVVGAVVRAAADGAALGRWRERGASVVELPAVELVAFFEGGELVRFCGVRGGAEVGVLQGVDCVYAAAPVELEEFSEE